MKLSAHSLAWSPARWEPAVSRANMRRAEVVAIPSGYDDEYCDVSSIVRPRGHLTTALRVVGILAFCQTVFFIVLFLFLCARAGAAPESLTRLELKLSEYSPKEQRDPFGSGVASSNGAEGTQPAQSTGPITLKLQGILYHAVHPAAMVNGQLVELNKPVALHSEQGDFEAKAVEITREIVLLEVGGQKIELRLSGDGDTGTTK